MQRDDSMLAHDMGLQCRGLPDLEVLHPPE